MHLRRLVVCVCRTCWFEGANLFANEVWDRCKNIMDANVPVCLLKLKKVEK